MIELQFADVIVPEIEALPGCQQWLEIAAQEVLRLAGEDASDNMTIVLSDDDELRRLNMQFLENDVPTDVLSFPSGEYDPDTQANYLGDIIISLARAQMQSTQAGHPLKDELQLLVVHGVLHLLGYDHLEEDEKVEMWRVQAEALELLGCSPSAIPR